MTFYLVLLCLGMFIALIGHIWLIVASFKQSVVWGLCVLFVPFAALVFIFRHWDEAKQPFLWSLLGSILIVVPVVMNWDTISKQKDFSANLASLKAQAMTGAAATPAPDQKPETPLMKKLRLEKMQTALAQHAAELKAKYDSLQTQWAKIPPKDKAARAVFDQQATVYQTMRKQVETEKTEVDALAASLK